MQMYLIPKSRWTDVLTGSNFQDSLTCLYFYRKVMKQWVGAKQVIKERNWRSKMRSKTKQPQRFLTVMQSQKIKGKNH